MSIPHPEEYREAVIDLGALKRNVRQLREVIGTDHFLVVVKANAYGHGMVPCAHAAIEGGANWLGVCDVNEALELRISGVSVPILAWLHAPGETFVEAVQNNITIGVSSIEQLDALAAAARAAEVTPVNVHLKLDTGLSRNGAGPDEWDALFAHARTLELDNVVHVEGIFSHLSNTSEAIDLASADLFDTALAAAASFGLTPELIHLAASSTALAYPRMRYNMVRVGITAYGLSPDDAVPAADLGLTPVMTLRGQVAAVRRVPAGTGLSYDHLHVTTSESTLALVPLGYAEGVPRSATNTAPVSLGGKTYTISGRVAMDQFIVDVGDDAVSVGDEVVLFGDPAQGYPSAADWARACGTIGYEIVTRIGGRVTHVFAESA